MTPLSILAETLISGDWLISLCKMALVAAGPAGAAWIIAFKKGKASTTLTKIEDPVPEIPVKRVYSPPSFSQHMEVVRRLETLETDHAKLRQEVAKQYVELLKVGEERKDKIIDEFNRVATGFHSRVNQLVSELHLSKPPSSKS